MELQYKPDFSEAKKRVEAFWNRAIIDRPSVWLTCPSETQRALPAKTFKSHRDRWLDVEYAVERADVLLSNTQFLGESIPAFFPNIGPDLIAAGYGCPMEFGETTSWSKALLNNWEDIETVRFDPNNQYIQKILEMTKLGLELGKGKFITGHTDIHPGGDLVAAIRGPQQLCVDLIESPDEVMALIKKTWNGFWDIYELQYQLMKDAGQTVTTTWLRLWCEGKYYVPSNDFSCMVSNRMFKKFFIPELIEEIEWLDRSIYHLDGPDALQHLDTLLSIPKLGGVQWVYGAGKGRATDWLDVYKRIQAADKVIQLDVSPNEIDVIMANLKPEGVMMFVNAKNRNEANAVMAKLSKWV